MKKLTKNSLLSFLVVALLAIVCAFGVMGYNNSNTAKADWQAPDYSAATDAESGFYFEEGAGVRTTTKGIKFAARVTEEFDATGDYTYFATAKVNGGAKEVALQFSADPVFNEAGVAELNAYINFDNVSEEIWQTALAADWEVNAYAYDGANCIKAANGGEENLRSMRYVATAAVLDWTEDAPYDKEDLTSYFTEANIQEGINGYTEATNGDFFVSLPGAPVDATEIYVNTEKYDAENTGLYYDEEISRFWMTYEPAYEMELGTINKAMMFTEDGKVYATKIAQGTPIATEDDMIDYFTSGSVATWNKSNREYVENAKDVEGYYFLTADIEMTKTWGYVSNLYGTLDGQGYTISNIKYAHIYATGTDLKDGNGPHIVEDNKYFALFNPYGGTIKNIGLEIAAVGTHGGLVFGRSGEDYNSTMENLFVSTTVGTYPTDALIALPYGGRHEINNVILHKMPNTTNATVQATVTNFTRANSDKVAPVVVVKNVHATANQPAKGPAGATVYDSVGALAAATKEIRTPEQERALNTFETWIEIDQTNVVSVFKSKGINKQVLVLMEDVDLKGVALTFDAQVNWSGILDGNGHVIDNLRGNLFSKYVNSGATIRNIVFRNAVVNHGVLAGQSNTGLVTFENVGLDIRGRTASYSSLIGQASGANYVIKDVLVVNRMTDSQDGLLTNTMHTGTYKLSGFYGAGSVGLTSATSKDTHGAATFGGYKNADGSADAVSADKAAEGQTPDYTLYNSADGFYDGILAGTIVVPENIRALAFAMMTPINQENAVATFKAGLSTAYYYLEEDIDLEGAAVSAADKTIFSGAFNGNGHTIANVSTVGLFGSNMSGKAIVKNVGFYGITNAGTGGVLAKQSNNTSVKPSDILIENVVVNYHAVSGLHGLLGQSVGMNVKFSNVVVNFEENNTTTTGYIGNTSMSGIKVYDKFIGIGSKATVTAPTGTYASSTKAHIAGFYGAASTNWGAGSEYGADGTSAPVANKDYYNFASYADFEAQLETNAFGLSDMALALIAKTGLVHKITAENVGILRNVTNGDYYLAQDIDMSTVDLNGDGVCDDKDVWTSTQSRNMPFVGILDGNGHSITNLKLGGKNYNGFFGSVGGGALIKDIKIEVVSQAHLNAALIGMINTGFASGYTLTDGRVQGEINVVNSVISSKDLKGTKGLVSVFNNSSPKLVLTDVVLIAEGTEYDNGYVITGGGNAVKLTVDDVLVVVADSTTATWADGKAPEVTGDEIVYATDSTTVETMYADNDTILGFFGFNPF